MKVAKQDVERWARHRSPNVQRRLLAEKEDLTFEKAFELAQSLERAPELMKKHRGCSILLRLRKMKKHVGGSIPFRLENLNLTY